MRIVIATPFYPPEEGVLSRYAQGLRDAFQGVGHDVRVVSFDHGLPPLLRHVVYFFRVMFVMRGAAFVLALDTWSVGFPTLLAAHMMHIPFFVRIGGDFLWETHVERVRVPVLLSEFYEKPRSLSLKEKLIFRGTKMITRHAEGLLFTTLFQRRLWEKAYHIETAKMHHIENYFPASEVGETAQRHIFVQAGRNRYLKNTNLLHVVVRELKTRFPDIDLDARSLPHTEHIERLRRAYAVIIPSFSEVCSNTAIEAVSYGVPFIMTRDTGTSERLGACGLFIDTRSKTELMRAIESMCVPETHDQLARKAREFSFRHSWEAMAKEILGIIKK